MLFADDLQIYIQCRRADINSAITRLNEDAEAIVRWCYSHGFLINIPKTKAIILGSTQNLMRIDRSELNPVVVNGTVIPFVNSAKNLGVVLSDDLTWNSHISQIYSRVNFILYRLRYKGYNLSSQLKAKLVSALLIPHFDYACVVFHGLTKYCAERLQVLLNITIRFIFHLRKDSELSGYYRKLNWLSLDHRRNYFLGVMMYRVLTSKQPEYLFNFLWLDSGNVVRRSPRFEPSPFIRPTPITATFENTFSIQGMALWDSIPTSIRISRTVDGFKAKLFSHYLSLS